MHHAYPSFGSNFLKADGGYRIQFWEFSSKGKRQEINLKWLSTAYLPRLNEVIWRYNLPVNQIRLQKWSENTKREENCHCKNWLKNKLLNFPLQLMLSECVIWHFVIPYFIFWRKKNTICVEGNAIHWLQWNSAAVVWIPPEFWTSLWPFPWKTWRSRYES